MKNQKGITLVALILTIIVLLILTVVTIAAVKGDSIIAHANTAKTKYMEASMEENQAIANYLKYFDDDDLPQDLVKLRNYFLNAPEGQKMTDSNGKFINNERLEDADLIENLGIIDLNMETQMAKISIKYNENFYFLTVSLSDEKATAVDYLSMGELEGTYVYYNYDGEHPNSKWVVLYSGQQIKLLSMDALGQPFGIGVNDSRVQNYIAEADLDNNGVLDDVEKTIYSYNNLPAYVDEKCRSVITETTFAEPNSARNAMSGTQIGDRIKTTDIKNYSGDWFDKYNDKIERELEINQDEEVKMMLLKVLTFESNGSERNYLAGSRLLFEDDNSIDIEITVRHEGFITWKTLLEKTAVTQELTAKDTELYVRPVVTLKSNVSIDKTSGDGSIENPYSLSI